jgi:ribosomal protein S18 acetylase RimI-like enzyme
MLPGTSQIATPLIDPAPVAAVVPPSLRLAAARRLVAQNSETEVAARRLIHNAPQHGIDLNLLFAVTEPSLGRTAASLPKIRQVCLVVRGTGRTTMVFLSSVPPGGDPAGPGQGVVDRVACLNAAQAELHRTPPVPAVMQALPDPVEVHATQTFDAAGFTRVGQLYYLRRPGTARLPAQTDRPLPAGIEIRPLSQLPTDDHDHVIIQALDRSYRETMDCPELCGMRSTADILVSHRATGTWTPDLWWVIYKDAQPQGCLLLNPCPDQQSIELVYLGLSPELRNQGLGSRVLRHGLATALAHRLGRNAEEVTCAVDTRNTPAMALYERFGFTSFAQRIAFVKRV